MRWLPPVLLLWPLTLALPLLAHAEPAASTRAPGPTATPSAAIPPRAGLPSPSTLPPQADPKPAATGPASAPSGSVPASAATSPSGAAAGPPSPDGTGAGTAPAPFLGRGSTAPSGTPAAREAGEDAEESDHTDEAAVAARATASPRPRLACAIGFGTSFDDSGLSDGRTVTVPAFQVSVGAGDRALGFEANLMSTQASGRYRRVVNSRDDIGVDRAALDLLLALRPAVALRQGGFLAGDPLPAPAGYLDRVWQSVTLDVGATVERMAPGTQSAIRLGALLAAHVDVLPLTPVGAPSGLAVRLALRRAFTPRTTVGATEVRDTRLDLLISLAATF